MELEKNFHIFEKLKEVFQISGRVKHIFQFLFGVK